MIETVRVKARYLVARRGLAVALALLLLAAASGGAAGIAYANADSSYTVTEREHVQTFRLTANDSAVVTGETPLWEKGTVLRNKPVYLTDVSPNLTVTSVVRTPDGTEVRISHRVELVVEASVGGEPLWRDRRTLTTTSTTVTDGRLVAETPIDVPATIERLNRLRRELSDSVTLSTRLRLRARYESDRYSGTLSRTVPIALGTDSYSIGSFQPAERSHAETTTHRESSADASLPTTTLLGGATSLLSVLGALVAVVGMRRLGDPEQLYRELERERLDEWISAGAVPNAALSDPVRLDSLTDLVDVAIDANERVVHDEARGIYAVIDGSTTYTYSAAETGFVFGANEAE